MTRAEHLTWAKQRALEYLERGRLTAAFASLSSDLSKHLGTDKHPELLIGTRRFVQGHLSDPAAMREFIEKLA